VKLSERLHGRVTVVGIGNPLRGDDAIGCHIAGRLADACRRGTLTRARGLTVLDVEEVPENYLGTVAATQPDVVLLVDAADLGASPGASALVEGNALTDAGSLTHRTSIAITAAVLRQMTGAEVLLLAVQPASLEWGTPLSPSVASAADSVSALLQEALAC